MVIMLVICQATAISALTQVQRQNICDAGLGSMKVVLGSKEHGCAGEDPDGGSMSHLIMQILCNNSLATVDQLEILSMHLAAWHLTQSWLQVEVGFDQRLPEAQVKPTKHQLMHIGLVSNASMLVVSSAHNVCRQCRPTTAGAGNIA